MCVIKEYRYYTISLRKYHGWCQYHKFMSIGSKTVKQKKVRKGQKRSIWSKIVNMFKTGQKPVKKVTNGHKRSKTVTKRYKKVKKVMVLGRSTMVIGRSTMVLRRSTVVLGTGPFFLNWSPPLNCLSTQSLYNC